MKSISANALTTLSPVTPFAGVWIEIVCNHPLNISKESLPSRECGLKFLAMRTHLCTIRVTPFAGVWIEICNVSGYTGGCKRSLPSRECGLKSDRRRIKRQRQAVTPFAGVWIEIMNNHQHTHQNSSLPSRECGLKFTL